MKRKIYTEEQLQEAVAHERIKWQTDNTPTAQEMVRLETENEMLRSENRQLSQLIAPLQTENEIYKRIIDTVRR